MWENPCYVETSLKTPTGYLWLILQEHKQKEKRHRSLRTLVSCEDHGKPESLRPTKRAVKDQLGATTSCLISQVSVRVGREANCAEVRMRTRLRLTLSTWIETLGSLRPGNLFPAHTIQSGSFPM